MKTKIIYLVLVLFLFGCSKQQQAALPALPFNVTRMVTPETKELDVIRDQAMAFLKAKDYNKLDELAVKFRSSKDCYADGTWKLSELYYALAVSNNIYGMEMFSQIPDKSFEDRIAELQDWVAAKPDSITARLALASVQIDYGWNARGGGYANTVTDESWRQFGERLKEAAETLREARDMNEKCPWYWYEMMRLAGGMQLPERPIRRNFQSGNHLRAKFRSVLYD